MNTDGTEKERVITTPDPDSSTIGPESETGQDVEQGRDISQTKPSEIDPNLVDWDGPNDQEIPMNWSDKKKWTNIGILSIMTLVTPLGSSMFAPGIPRIMMQFHESSSTVATFLLSVYILGFAFGPLLIAPLSEIFGRRSLYLYGNILFVLFSVGAALSNSIGMLMAFRLLMGLAGAVPVTIGSGSIADLMPVEKRGGAMAAWALGPLLGPCIGPIAGGYLIEAAGWEWVYWLVAILAGVLIPISFFFLRETFIPVLLERKTQKLRKETGNQNLRSALSGRLSAKHQFQHAIVRPMKLLLLTPIVTAMALYVAFAYGIMYLLITTFSFVYAEQYGFGEGASGLTFLPAGLGMMVGVAGFGALMDSTVRKHQAKGIAHKPEFRITPSSTIPCGAALPIGLFIYGWTAYYGVHWIVPMIGVFIFSAGSMGVMFCVQNYLLDVYPMYAASVTAALTVLRSLLGALLPLGGLEMYNALGLGWGNSLLAFISLALIPVPLVLYIFGERIRSRFNPKL